MTLCRRSRADLRFPRANFLSAPLLCVCSDTARAVSKARYITDVPSIARHLRFALRERGAVCLSACA